VKEALIIDFDINHNDVKSEVYQGTLRHIASKLSCANTYKFVDAQSLLLYWKKHKFPVAIFTNTIPLDVAVLLKELGVVQVVIGMRQDIVNISDIIIDPLIYENNKYLVGTKYLLSSVVNNADTNEIAHIIGIKPRTLKEESDYNEAERELTDVVQVCQKLDWDSKFFGVNIGFISCFRLTHNIENYVREFIRDKKIDMLEYLCNCHDRESVLLSEEYNYSFVDMRLTFEQYLHEDINVPKRKGYSLAKGKKKDIAKLKEIGTDIYKYSRYYYDENFDRKKVVEFYLNWIEKAILGTFDDYAYVLYHNTEPIGFCSIKKTKNKKAASIGLLGLSVKYIGQGLGRYMLNLSLKELKKEGVNHIETVTQGRNYKAQRLYQRCGFVTKKTELWYHKWFR